MTINFKQVLHAKKKFVPSEVELDMTPMVDVTFQLLIFFMLTATFVQQRSLNMPKPKDESQTASKSIEEIQEASDTVTVRVDGNGTFYISAAALGDDEIEVPSRQELYVKLKQARQPDASGNIPTRLLVMANGDAIHGRVVMAIDAGNEIGMESVQLVTQEDEE